MFGTNHRQTTDRNINEYALLEILCLFLVEKSPVEVWSRNITGHSICLIVENLIEFLINVPFNTLRPTREGSDFSRRKVKITRLILQIWQTTNIWIKNTYIDKKFPLRISYLIKKGFRVWTELFLESSW